MGMFLPIFQLPFKINRVQATKEFLLGHYQTGAKKEGKGTVAATH